MLNMMRSAGGQLKSSFGLIFGSERSPCVRCMQNERPDFHLTKLRSLFQLRQFACDTTLLNAHTANY